jgi:hypothetical protein
MHGQKTKGSSFPEERCLLLLSKLYIPSIVNADLIFWHTHLIVTAVCRILNHGLLNHGLFLSLFKVIDVASNQSIFYAQKTELSIFFLVFIVLGMYNFGYI